MTKLSTLADYRDERGNLIESPTTFDKNVSLTIRGSNNRITIDPKARIAKIRVIMDCDNGTLTIGPNSKHGFDMSIRIGQDASVRIGADVTTTSTCIVSAVEGATITIGDDVMLASGNQIRADDGHPIFDVKTGTRVNPVKDIRIGNHVWLGAQAVALAGAKINDGSVVGFRSLVTGQIPNNCIAAGTPAKVIRRNIAWERPHLSFVAPPYKPDASTIAKSEEYWRLTQDSSTAAAVNLPFDAHRTVAGVARRLRRIARNLLLRRR